MSNLTDWMRRNFDAVRGESPEKAAKLASWELGYTVKRHDVTTAFNAVDSERKDSDRDGYERSRYRRAESEGGVNILAIDPGNEQSAWCVYNGERPIRFGIARNTDLIFDLDAERNECYCLYVEMVSGYGMPVGREVFETCVWIGRFIQAWRCEQWKFVYRPEVKLHLCNSRRAKDQNVRQAMLDRFGGSRAAAIGVKKNRGPLYGVSKDVWAALAVAVTAWDTHHAMSFAEAEAG